MGENVGVEVGESVGVSEGVVLGDICVASWRRWATTIQDAQMLSKNRTVGATVGEVVGVSVGVSEGVAVGVICRSKVCMGIQARTL